MLRFLDRPSAEMTVSAYAQSRFIAPLLVQLLRHHVATVTHVVRVADFAVDLALEQRLPVSDVFVVAQSGLLHDIGKLKISTAILNKESALTDDERRLMHEHSRFGFEILSALEFDGVREIVVAHHEWKVHDPYPRAHIVDARQSAHGVLLLQQIVAIADTVDALLSGRPYNPKYSIPEVRALLVEHFAGDPQLLAQTLRRLVDDSVPSVVH